MYGLEKMLVAELNYLENIIRSTKNNMSNLPDGKLRISSNDSRVRYYHRMNNEEIYIPKKDSLLANQLAQKSYDEDLLKKSEKILKQVKKLLKCYTDHEIEDMYLKLHENRQKLVIPIEPTWEQFCEIWMAEEYQGKEFTDNYAIILTEKGERVRSKSEKILADYFYHKGIPYKYEKPLYLNGYGIIYPDFTLLAKSTRKTVFWEHAGMMDSPEYAKKAIKKIEQYEKNGIFPGDGLILTFETTQGMTDTKVLDRLIQKYFL